MNKQLNSVRNIAQQFFGEDLTSDALWDLLVWHRCYGLLRELPCPEAQRKTQRLNSILKTNDILTRYRYCTPLFQSLQQQKIPYAVHKGAVLSQSLYGSPFVRQSGDVDLLICRDDADRVKQLLFSEGFVQGRVTETGIEPFTRPEILYHAANTHQLAPFVKNAKNPLCPYVKVDINIDLLWGESVEKTDMALVLSKTEPIRICNFSLRKLTAEYEFIALCLHHYKDMNSLYLLYDRGIRLGHLCDIYDYLHVVSPIPDKIAAICKELCVTSYVKTCILLACRVFGMDATMESFLCMLEGEDLSDSFGLKKEEFHVWELPLSHRIFGDVRGYLDRILSPEEKEKVLLNRSIMM